MLAKFLTIISTVITAVYACDGAAGLSVNPMTAPSADNWPTIGQPFEVKWSTDYPNLSPQVTLSLYKITGDCPGNACVELADIAGFYTNNGSFTWTPSNSLAAGNNYALLFINENPCLTVWGAAFGIHPEGYTGGSAASGLAPAAAALVTDQAAAAAASTGNVAASTGDAAASTGNAAAAASTAAAQSFGTTGALRTRYTTVYATATMYTTYTPSATSDQSMAYVTVTETTVVYQTLGAVSSGFSLAQ